MGFTYEDKIIDSIFIDKIWHTRATSDGIYTASLDGNWDIIIVKTAAGTNVFVNGVGRSAARVPYITGTEYVGITLKPGVFLRDLKGTDIVDSQHVLTKNGNAYVQLGGYTFKIPTFDTAELFVEALLEKDILLINPIVSSFDEGDAKSFSGRSLRRHVAQTTGLSPYFFHQIQRAQHAVQLLQRGMPIAQAAAEAGYTDQAHMTKAVKQLIGRTPAQIIADRQT
jgi:hypothetical protein